LHVAARNGRVDAVRLLLEAGAPVSPADTVRIRGERELGEGVTKRMAAAVIILLERCVAVQQPFSCSGV
jgi:hypothetical protein